MSISPNIQELESPSRKRNHEAYSEEEAPGKGLPLLESEEASGKASGIGKYRDIPNNNSSNAFDIFRGSKH
jgi:hypothetical protein